jgi:Fe-S oxidoreductase
MALFKKLMAGNTLYYPGCLIKFAAKDLEENYKKLLSRMGVDFIQLRDMEFCCGSPVMNAGHKREMKELAKKNLMVFHDHGVSKIITSCPACYKVFTKDYPEILGREWDIEVEHVTRTIVSAMKRGKLKIKKKEMVITYHDPCHLGRHCGIYEEPREILQSKATLKEMRLAKELSFCCGGGSGVKSNYPELANAAAKERVGMARETKAKCLVTTCPMCYANLKENSEGIEVQELSQFLGDEQ